MHAIQIRNFGCSVFAVDTPPANDPTPVHLSEIDRAAEVALSSDTYPDRWAAGAAERLAYLSKLILQSLCKRERVVIRSPRRRGQAAKAA